LLYRTYYELVSPETADAYWGIIPASVKAQREAEKAKREAQAKAEQAEAANYNKQGDLDAALLEKTQP
jgi:hypothetical protein